MGRPASIRDQGQTISEISAETGLHYRTLRDRYVVAGLRGAALRAPALRGKGTATPTPTPTRKGRAASGVPHVTVKLRLPLREAQGWGRLRTHYQTALNRRDITIDALIRASMADLVSGLPRKK